tara:strand:+ start:1878 stop:2723 length:846 start_codon:yes stop_codon:yes gene_type:complete
MLLGLTAPVNIDSTSSQRFSRFNFETVGDGGDRCCNSGCMVRVKPGSKKLVAKVKNESSASSIYFEEDSAVLDSAAVAKIRNFAKPLSQSADVTLIGYTDGCGGWDYNKDLSMRRAAAVKRQILKLKPNLSVRTEAAGEVSHGHSSKNRKVHLTTTKNVILYEPPPKLIADFYLIDGSGSMQGTKFEVYRRAINYHRPPGSKVYVATTTCTSNMKSFNMISPGGGTEIWYAYWFILDKMAPGQSLVIISDFDSKYPLTQREKRMIQEKVKKRKVSVRAISI